MTFQVLLHPNAARFLEKTDTTITKRLKEHLKELRQAPEKKGERLKGSQFWRMRVEDHRVVYEIDRTRNRVIVPFIGHKRDVYDDFSRLL